MHGKFAVQRDLPLGKQLASASKMRFAGGGQLHCFWGLHQSPRAKVAPRAKRTKNSNSPTGLRARGGSRDRWPPQKHKNQVRVATLLQVQPGQSEGVLESGTHGGNSKAIAHGGHFGSPQNYYYDSRLYTISFSLPSSPFKYRGTQQTRDDTWACRQLFPIDCHRAGTLAFVLLSCTRGFHASQDIVAIVSEC